MNQRPAVSLAAIPGRRKTTIELAQEIEHRGFSGIYCPSIGDSLALCEAIALSTSRIEFGTSITPIYTRNVQDFAQTAAFIHEVSAGRFKFGVGISHVPAMSRIGITPGKPLADMREFVTDLNAVPRVGELPPIIFAALRTKMIQLAEELAQGMVFANGARSYYPIAGWPTPPYLVVPEKFVTASKLGSMPVLKPRFWFRHRQQAIR